MDSFERFDETQLPEKEKFYSSLSGEGITDEEYERAKQVWDTFGCRNLGDYHNLYVATDTLLLADAFENFRKVCQDKYGLDPAHYYSAPGLSWDALLKKTGVELELLTDLDMHLFIERGMRGGISMASKRYAKANKPLVEGYDPTQPTNYITYLDANNLLRMGNDPASAEERFSLETSDADGRADNENEAQFKETLDTGGGPRVPCVLARCPQRLSAGAGKQIDKIPADVGIPAAAYEWP